MHLSQSAPLICLTDVIRINALTRQPPFVVRLKRPSVAKGGAAIITQLKINGKEWGEKKHHTSHK